MPGDSKPAAAKPRVVLIVGVLSFLAAGLYGLLPFSYAYFQNPPFIRYSPDRIGMALRRTEPAAWYDKAWLAASPPPPGASQAVTEGDITCQLRPAGTAPGCAQPLQPGVFVSGYDKPLPEGAYRAVVRIAAPEGCTGGLALDVISPDFNFILTQISPSISAAATQPQAMDFAIDDIAADRAAIELRVRQTSGPACATLEQVTLMKHSQ